MARASAARKNAKHSASARTKTLSDDIWPLIWVHLSSKDLLFASHVCHSWRIESLYASRLWGRLTLFAYDSVTKRGRPKSGTKRGRLDAVKPVSNLCLLRQLLPRSKQLPLTLDVEITTLLPSEFCCELCAFLELVAPRLAILRMFTVDPTFAGRTFCQYERVYPVLRVLDLSSSVSKKASRFSSGWEVDFVGDRLPKLVSLALHREHKLHCVSTWINIQELTCTVNTILDIEPLLLTAIKVQRLCCECVANNLFDPEDAEPPPTWPNVPLLCALSAIPDIHLKALYEPEHVEFAFQYFASAPRPRLLLDFAFEEYDGALRLQTCGQLSAATQLTLEIRDDSIVVTTGEDGGGRIMRIAVNGVRLGTLEPVFDWEDIPSFPALTRLFLDARLWPEIVHSFPRAPLLARIVLRFRRTRDMDFLMSDVAVCAVPEGVALALTADVPVTDGEIEVLRKALGVACIESMVPGVREVPD